MSQTSTAHDTTKENSLSLFSIVSLTLGFLISFIAAFLFIGSHSVEATETIDADLNSEYFTEKSVSDSELAGLDQNTESQSNYFAQSDANADANNESSEPESNQCNFITDNLRIDFNNDQEQVLRLQAFLKAYRYDYVDLTGSFDENTLRAVRAFQSLHAEDILKPWGYEPDETTGYVYITTKQKINEIYCNQDLTLNDEQSAEIQQFRNNISEWRQQGASFENPQYLSQYDSQLAQTTVPDADNGESSGSVAGDEDILAQTDESSTENEEMDSGSNSATSADSAEEQTTTSTEENQNGFFDRLFGSNDSGTSSETESNAVEDGSNTPDEATSSDGQADVATGLDQAATSVYSGVNSVVGFILSPTFLLVLLGLLILLLIATLLEDENAEGGEGIDEIKEFADDPDNDPEENEPVDFDNESEEGTDGNDLDEGVFAAESGETENTNFESSTSENNNTQDKSNNQ